MEDGDDDGDRLSNEVELLRAIYPDEVNYRPLQREIQGVFDGGKLVLRLPDDYPGASRPEVVSALVGSTDVRAEVLEIIRQGPSEGEALDAILASFLDLVRTAQSREMEALKNNKTLKEQDVQSTEGQLVVIVWLHHLLSSTKRKAILSPDSKAISGVSKPGYPGVLVFSGPTAHVREHVHMLRAMNWQAFQVRAEENTAWEFAHGEGVVELETMSDVVAAIHERNRKIFMEAMRMR